MKTKGASVYGALALFVVAIQPEAIFAVDPPVTIVVDAASFLHDLPQHDIWIDGGSGFGTGRGGRAVAVLAKAAQPAMLLPRVGVVVHRPTAALHRRPTCPAATRCLIAAALCSSQRQICIA